MPRYSEEFKRNAVALYEDNEALSLKAASAELGINLKCPEFCSSLVTSIHALKPLFIQSIRPTASRCTTAGKGR